MLSDQEKKTRIDAVIQETDYFKLDGAKNYLSLIKNLLGSVKNKKILDIACGSGRQEKGRSRRIVWHPLILLLAASEGAYGTGIDLNEYENAQDVYHHIQADLIPYLTDVHPLIDLFANLPTEHSPPFDFILCLNFLMNVSPLLDDMLTQMYNNDSLKRWKALNGMKRSLLRQSLELGKEGTVIRIDLETYVIKDGTLVELTW